MVTFIEVGAAIFPLTVIDAVVLVLAAADSALRASGTSFAAMATPAAAVGPPVLAEAETVGLAAGALLAVTESSIAVSWVASVVDGVQAAPVSYTLQCRVTGGGAWTQIVGITGTAPTVTGLSAATGYDFQV